MPRISEHEFELDGEDYDDDWPAEPLPQEGSLAEIVREYYPKGGRE